MWRPIASLAFLAVLCATIFPALAENRLALVIGNDRYEHIEPLRKAVADAKGYAAVLREKDYRVSEGYDLKTLDIDAAVAAFIDSIQPGDTAVFVYSGHGWSDGAQNYIVGVDAPASASAEFLAKISVPIKNDRTGVLDDMERKGAGLKVAIVDACRENPFAPPPGTKGFAFKRGFAPMAAPPVGTFVVFSAGAGQSALDKLSEADIDPNSVFTRVFLPLLRADMTLQEAIKASQAQVVTLARSAGSEQKPAYYDEVIGPACLSTVCKTAGPLSSQSDEIVGALIDQFASSEQLELIVARLPDGALKERARARLEALKAKQVASLEPKPAPSRPSGTGRAAMLIAVASGMQRPAVSNGSVVWSTVPATRGLSGTLGAKAEVDIPDLKLHATMTLGDSADVHMAHTIALLLAFDVGSPIKGVKGMGMPQMRGADPPAQDPLVGKNWRMRANQFVVALNRGEVDAARIDDLIAGRSWFVFSLLLDDDRNATLMFEKSAEGERIVAEVVAEWK